LVELGIRLSELPRILSSQLAGSLICLFIEDSIETLVFLLAAFAIGDITQDDGHTGWFILSIGHQRGCHFHVNHPARNIPACSLMPPDQAGLFDCLG
jgi:hypothetical protein